MCGHVLAAVAKGFEIGSGFAGAKMKGSEHNDEFYMTPDGQVRAHQPALLLCSRGAILLQE